MQIGSLVVYKDTENSPVFQVVEEPTETSVVCTCVENGNISIANIVLQLDEIQEV